MAVKSKIGLELDTLKYSSKDIQISKPAADNVAQRFFDQVMEGEISAMQVVESLNFFGEVEKCLKDKVSLTGNTKWTDLVRDEITKAGTDNKSAFSKYGTKFSLAENGTKYDYTVCNDPVWNSLAKRIESLTTERKERETFLKTIKKVVIMSFPDPETGELLENVELIGPIKSSTLKYITVLAHL